MRVGHRIPRDQRVSLHVALVSRAFGAHEVWVDKSDLELEERVRHVVDRFGGPFTVRTGVKWQRAVREWGGKVVHLTMYGEQLDEVLERIPEDDLLIVVGAGKMPREAFEMADLNVAVGNQPHSEVAALAVFLDRLLKGEGIKKRFPGPLKVVPSARGKIVEETT